MVDCGAVLVYGEEGHGKGCTRGWELYSNVFYYIIQRFSTVESTILSVTYNTECCIQYGV